MKSAENSYKIIISALPNYVAHNKINNTSIA